MRKDEGYHPDRASLRRRAEEGLADKDTGSLVSLSGEEAKRLVHELQVHQVELELQNEELRQARAELEASLERYTDLYDFAPAGYFSLDEQGVIAEVNLAGASLLGFGRAQVRGQALVNFLAPESRAVFRGMLERWRVGRDRQSCEVKIAFAGRGLRYAHLEVAPVELLVEEAQGAQNDVCRLVALDISQRKQAEDELRESQAFNQSIINSSPDCIEVLDLHGRRLYISPASLGLLGLDDAQACLGLSYEKLWSTSDQPVVLAALAKARVGQKAGFLAHRPTGNGETKWWEVGFSPIVDAQDRIGSLLVVSRDVTERIRAEGERIRVEALLRHSQKMEAVGTLAGGIAHDFNNILAAIMGYAEIVRTDLDAGKGDMRDMDQILASAGRARELVSQILTFSRETAYFFKPMDLNRTVSGVAEVLARTMPKSIAVEVEVASHPSLISGDAGSIERVLLNLAVNARDAMPEGGRLSLKTSQVFLDEEFHRQHLEVAVGPYVLLEVSDGGQGMDQHTLDLMYDPFFTTKEVGKGTGLGLSTVHGIIKAHGGHLWCASTLGQGTIFSIYLPALRNTLQPPLGG